MRPAISAGMRNHCIQLLYLRLWHYEFLCFWLKAGFVPAFFYPLYTILYFMYKYVQNKISPGGGYMIGHPVAEDPFVDFKLILLAIVQLTLVIVGVALGCIYMPLKKIGL